MAQMKHEIVQLSEPAEGMSSCWVTIRVVDDDCYKELMAKDRPDYDYDLYVSAKDFAAKPYEAISKAVDELLQSRYLLFSKKMRSASANAEKKPFVPIDGYLATYLVEVQLPTPMVESTEANTNTGYKDAFELPQGSTISPDQFKRLVLGVLKLEYHVLLFANMPAKALERHEIAIFKENDRWVYLLPGNDQPDDFPNEFAIDWDRPFHEVLEIHRKRLIRENQEYVDLCAEEALDIHKRMAPEVLTPIAAVGHIPADLGLDHHFPLELPGNYDPANLAMALNQGALQADSNLSKLPTDLLNVIFAEATDKTPEQTDAYMSQVKASVKDVYNNQIAPQLICKANWGQPPSLSLFCPNDLALVDKFAQTGLLPFSEFVRLDKENHQIIIPNSSGPGHCGVYKANNGQELAIAFASQEQRDAWAKLMGLQHDFYNEGVGIWSDRPNCIYFTEKYFNIQEVKQYIMQKQQEFDGLTLSLEKAAEGASSPLVGLSLFSTEAMTQHMTERFKTCNEQIIAARLLLGVLGNKMSAEDLQDKYASFVSVIEKDEVLANLWQQIGMKDLPSPGA